MESQIQILKRHRNEYLAAFTATLSLLATVCAAGWSSPAIPALKDEGSPIPITADQGSWIVAILSIGSLLGPVLTSLTVDSCGRKLTLLLSVIPLSIGWIMIALAEHVHTIYIARFLHGISYGTAYSAAPIYLGEISSTAIRGSTGVLVTVMAKLAFLIQYSIGPFVAFETLAWISLIFPVLFMILFYWMPESPYYWLSKSNDTAALASLCWLRRCDEYSEVVRREYSEMKTIIEKNRHRQISVRELFVKSNRKCLIIILLMSCGMQFTGINAILGYSQTIFSNLHMSLHATELSIILAIVQLLAVIVPTFLIDKAGRRPLLLISCGGSLLGLAFCSVYFTLDAFNYPVQQFSWVPFLGTLIFIISFAIGLATVPFAILGEIFPKNIKAKANAMFAIITSVAVFAVVKLFQVVSDGIGTYVSFWAFCVCTAITGTLIYFIIPETKGLSFGEIQEIMIKNNRNERREKTFR